MALRHVSKPRLLGGGGGTVDSLRGLRSLPILAMHSSVAVSIGALPAGAMASTIPQARACCAATCSPVSISCKASSVCMMRGRRCVPWPPGRKPMLTSGTTSAMLFFSEHAEGWGGSDGS